MAYLDIYVSVDHLEKLKATGALPIAFNHTQPI